MDQKHRLMTLKVMYNLCAAVGMLVLGGLFLLSDMEIGLAHQIAMTIYFVVLMVLWSLYLKNGGKPGTWRSMAIAAVASVLFVIACIYLKGLLSGL